MKITDEELYKCAPQAESLWLNMLPPDEKILEHKFSRRFERKMKRLIRDQKRSAAARRAIAATKHVAAAILIVTTVSFSCLMTVDAYREKFIAAVTEVFYDLTHFRFFSSWDEELNLGEIELGYIPEGMSEARRDIYADGQGQTLYFESADGKQVSIDQQLATTGTDYDAIFDTEEAEVLHVTVNFNEALMIVKGGQTTLMLEDDPYVILITGNIGTEDIVQIAEEMSIVKK